MSINEMPMKTSLDTTEIARWKKIAQQDFRLPPAPIRKIISEYFLLGGIYSVIDWPDPGRGT